MMSSVEMSRLTRDNGTVETVSQDEILRRTRGRQGNTHFLCYHCWVVCMMARQGKGDRPVAVLITNTIYSLRIETLLGGDVIQRNINIIVYYCER